MTEATIRECEDRIPSRWKEDPKWVEKLLFGMQQYYFSGYGLDRQCMKEAPKRLMKGMGRALIREPAYLVRRLASGLSWHTPDMTSAHDVVKGLIRDWHVPWPPKELHK